LKYSREEITALGKSALEQHLLIADALSALEMQLGGLSRAMFSKLSQLQAFLWLDFGIQNASNNYLNFFN